MRLVLGIQFFLIGWSVGAQGTDTSYFDYNWSPVEKSDRRFYYYTIPFPDENAIRCFTFKRDLYYYSEYADSTFRQRHGLTFVLDKNGDTTDKYYYKHGITGKTVRYEKGIPVEISVVVNDSVRYEFKVAGGKYMVSKKLYYGEWIYDFYGKDSTLFLNSLAYAFRKEKGMRDYFIFKFKVLPWVMGDDGGMSYSLGLEYTFGKVNSLDLTASYLDWQMDQDDSAGNDLPPLFQVRRGIQFGYRHYFLLKANARIFISPFVRYAKFQDYYFNGVMTNYFRNESWNYSGGLLLGLCVNGNDEDPFYTEFFAGPQYTYSQIAEGFTENNIRLENEYSRFKFGVRIGMNFCGLLSRRK